MEKYLNSKILIVDDEYANIFFLKRVLSGEGYQVISASNGYEAIEILDVEFPDVILLDIMMPEMTGIEVLKKLKEDDSKKDIPVIMVSAKTDSADIETALDLGAIEYIKKPVDEVELLARLRTTLRIKKYEKQLKDNIQAKEDFIGIVAHDLRTPFSTITGFTEILKNDEKLNKLLTDEHIEILDYIITSSSFIVEYFNKLLNWAQIGSKGLTLNRSLNSLYQLVEITEMIYKTKLENKNIKLKTHFTNKYKVYIDEIYFGQVISNLIGNAIKFTNPGGEIILTVERKPDESTILTIEDTGVGMDEETIKKIMNDKPVKSSRGTKGEKGTGLGLSVCKKIIESHKFKFDIQSKIDKGTKIQINMYPKELCEIDNHKIQNEKSQFDM